MSVAIWHQYADVSLESDTGTFYAHWISNYQWIMISSCMHNLWITNKIYAQMLYLDLIILFVKEVISSVKSVALYIRQTIYMLNYVLTID